MRLWIPALLLVAAGVRAMADSDSLKGALDAITRRQRDLGDGDEYMLGPYRYLPPKQIGVGQPEDIGYGFQKSEINNGGVFYSPPHIPENMEPERNVENLDGVLLGYLENEEFGHPKNSPFRELEKKSSFREYQENGDKDLRHMDDSFVRKLQHHEAGQFRDPEDHEYLSSLHSMWRKYKQEYPASEDSDDMSEEEVAHIIKYLRHHGILNKEDADGRKGKALKHFSEEMNQGNVNELLDSPRDVTGWSGRNHYRKRQEDKDEDEDETQRSLFYSSKYRSLPFNTEYAEVFGGEGEAATPIDRDSDDYGDDISVIPKHRSHLREQWVPSDNVYEQKEEMFPQYSPENEKPRKRVGGSRDLPLSTYAFLQPAYNTPSNRKRFPVTKRSPRLYASPPMLHHEKLTTSDHYDVYKKSSEHSNTTTTTDPKVVKELNQIFAAEENSKDVQANTKTRENHYGDDDSEPKQVDTDEKDFTEMPVNNETYRKIKQAKKSKNNLQNENAEDDSVTSQQEDEPIEIKKKSIDWSDYFGIDRRRKKLGPEHDHRSIDSAKRSDITEKWLQENYDRLSAKLTPEEKESNKKLKIYGHTLKRNQLLTQPLNTRNFEDGDISRNLESSLSKKNYKTEDGNNKEPLKIYTMDKKLQHIEDLILDQAVKYTGAHEDITDSQEIENVKDNVMSQLAAAYSLEKIRKALGEFKSIMAAQKNLKYYPENDVNSDNEDSMDKRIAVKKSKAVGKVTDKTGQINSKGDEASIENSVIQLLNDPIALSQLSEGYMGGRLSDERECASLNKFLNKCHMLDESPDDQKQMLAQICCLRQLCYACSPLMGEWPAHCDAPLVDACGNDAVCLAAADRCSNSLAGPEQCACIARYLIAD